VLEEKMSDKYQLLANDSIEVDGHKLYRIQALMNIITQVGTVSKGDLGGYIEKYDNLSLNGACWVLQNARVYGNALISDAAVVYGSAQVYNTAVVYERAHVYGHARVYDAALVRHEAHIHGNTRVHGGCRIRNSAHIYGNAQIYGDARINDTVSVYGNAHIHGDADLRGGAHYFDVDISGEEDELDFDEYEDTDVNFAARSS
jgi:carbonic anhydrase/acetyltransferase-like protein (isoleucine patch superfamily)